VCGRESGCVCEEWMYYGSGYGSRAENVGTGDESVYKEWKVPVLMKG